MSLLIDLDDVAAGNRAHSWSQTLRDHYLDLDIRFRSERPPAGKIVRSPLGSIVVSAMSSVAQTHDRTPLEMSDDIDHLFGWMQLRGDAHLAQCGREVDLRPGRFVILDAAQPYHAAFRDEYQILTIKIPRIYFEDVLQSKRDLINLCIDERHGSLVITDYFRRMAQNFDRISFEHRVRMSAHGVRLMVDSVAGAASARQTSASPSP